MKRKRAKAQTSLEYMILIVLAVGALLAMRVFVTRAVQERFRSGADTFGSGEQYVNSLVTNVTSYDGNTTRINRPAAAQGNACGYATLEVRRLRKKIASLSAFLSWLKASQGRGGSVNIPLEDVDPEIPVNLAAIRESAAGGISEINQAGADTDTGQQPDRGQVIGELEAYAPNRGSASPELAAVVKENIASQQDFVNKLANSAKNLQAGADGLKQQANLLKAEAEVKKQEFNGLADFCSAQAKGIQDAFARAGAAQEEVKQQLSRIADELDKQANETVKEAISKEKERLGQREQAMARLAANIQVEATSLQEDLNAVPPEERRGEDMVNYLNPIVSRLRGLESAYKVEAEGKEKEISDRQEFLSARAKELKALSQAERLSHEDAQAVVDAFSAQGTIYARKAAEQEKGLNQAAGDFTESYIKDIDTEVAGLNEYVALLQKQVDLARKLSAESVESAAKVLGMNEVRGAAKTLKDAGVEPKSSATAPLEDIAGALGDINSVGNSAHSLQTQINALEGLIANATSEMQGWQDNYKDCFP